MKHIHRPGFTLWHIVACCFLVAITARPEIRVPEYTDKNRADLNALVAKSQPRKGYVMYDSKQRAEVIAKVWNITPENIDSYREWW